MWDEEAVGKLTPRGSQEGSASYDGTARVRQGFQATFALTLLDSESDARNTWPLCYARV